MASARAPVFELDPPFIRVVGEHELRGVARGEDLMKFKRFDLQEAAFEAKVLLRVVNGPVDLDDAGKDGRSGKVAVEIK